MENLNLNGFKDLKPLHMKFSNNMLTGTISRASNGEYEYTVNSYVPFCCTQNLSGGYSIILQTFLCKVEGKIIPNSNETRNVRWMNVDDIYSSINKNLEAWYPMHINTLFKFIDYYQKGFIYE